MSTSPRTGHEAVESEADREAAAAAAAAERSASLWGRFNTAKRRYVAAVQGLPLLARVAPGVLPATVPAAAPTKGKVNVTLFSSITRPEMEAITEFRVARSAIASAHRALVRGGEAAPAKVSLEEVLGVPLPPPAARMAYRMANVSAPLMHCMFTAHGFKPSGNGASTFGGEAAPTSGAMDWHAMWVSSFLKSYAFQALRPGQVVNQFPRTYEVTRKDTLARNIMRMQELHGDRHFAFLPATYVLPADAAAFNAACARDPDTAWIVKPAASSKGKGIYIARCPEGYTQRDLAPGPTTPPDTPSSTAPTPPLDARRPAVSPLALAAAQAAAAAARSAGEDPAQSGTGSLSEVVNTARASNSGYRVSTATMGGPEFFTAANRRGMKRTPAHQALPSAPGMPPGSPGAAAAPLLGEGVARAVAAAAAEGLQGGVEDNCIVSRYIDEPALVDGFKYDLRVYAAVTSFCPLKVYIHKEGLARFATERYTPDPAQYQNKFVHLTNYSLNKASSKYQAGDGAEGAGHKWTLSALLARLLRDGVDVDAMWGRVEELIVKTLLSIEGNVTAAVNMFVPCPATNCFQLFGFDVMMDAELNPWLLEVNFSPSLATDSDLDLRVKSQVLADTLNLVGMPTATPPTPPFTRGRGKRRGRRATRPPPSKPVEAPPTPPCIFPAAPSSSSPTAQRGVPKLTLSGVGSRAQGGSGGRTAPSQPAALAAYAGGGVDAPPRPAHSRRRLLRNHERARALTRSASTRRGRRGGHKAPADGHGLSGHEKPAVDPAEEEEEEGPEEEEEEEVGGDAQEALALAAALNGGDQAVPSTAPAASDAPGPPPTAEHMRWLRAFYAEHFPLEVTLPTLAWASHGARVWAVLREAHPPAFASFTAKYAACLPSTIAHPPAPSAAFPTPLPLPGTAAHALQAAASSSPPRMLPASVDGLDATTAEAFGAAVAAGEYGAVQVFLERVQLASEPHKVPERVRRALIQDLSDEHWRLLCWLDSEGSRRGGYTRVFPTARVNGITYRQFFEEGRPLNALYGAYLMRLAEFERVLRQLLNAQSRPPSPSAAAEDGAVGEGEESQDSRPTSSAAPPGAAWRGGIPPSERRQASQLAAAAATGHTDGGSPAATPAGRSVVVIPGTSRHLPVAVSGDAWADALAAIGTASLEEVERRTRIAADYKWRRAQRARNRRTQAGLVSLPSPRDAPEPSEPATGAAAAKAAFDRLMGARVSVAAFGDASSSTTHAHDSSGFGGHNAHTGVAALGLPALLLEPWGRAEANSEAFNRSNRRYFLGV